MKKNDFRPVAAQKNHRTYESLGAYGKVPPQARELEESVIGVLLLEDDKVQDVMAIIPRPESFYLNAHQTIYSAILDIKSSGGQVDMLVVMDFLKKSGELESVGGAYGLTKITQSVVTSAHVVAHSRIIMQKYLQREIIRIAAEITQDSYTDETDVFEVIERTEKELEGLHDLVISTEMVPIQHVYPQVMLDIDAKRNASSDFTGVPTGLRQLDNVTNGWQKTDLIILAARPSVGKTAFALNIAFEAAKENTVAFFSLEMGIPQLVKRLIAMSSGVSLEAINSPKTKMNEYNWKTVCNDSKLLNLKLELDDRAGITVPEIKAKCRKLKRRKGLGLVVIDYLQLISVASNWRAGNREQEISRISRELKKMAKELDVPVLALSQLSREIDGRADPKPKLSDLRESGAIEQDADMVMFIYPPFKNKSYEPTPEDLKRKAWLSIAKHRNGVLEDIILYKDLSIQKFSDEEITTWDAEERFNPRAGFEALREKDYGVPVKTFSINDEESGLPF